MTERRFLREYDSLSSVTGGAPQNMKPNRTDTAHAGPPRPVTSRIMAGLTRALDWFDNSLQNVVASHGFKPFHRTQSMIIMHIALGIDAPSDIAREMGLTRQNVHHMARDLINSGVIVSMPDPRDPRRTLYRLSDDATELRSIALATITKLEQVLERRIGVDHVAHLRSALAADWGPEITSAGDLRASLPETRGRARSPQSGRKPRG
jgi:DNA-binding MarR family transcriptional regulator